CLERADALDLADARGGPARGRPGPCRPGRTSDRLRRLLRSRSRWRGPRAPTRAERGRIGVGERPAFVAGLLEGRPPALVAFEGPLADIPDLAGQLVDEVPIVRHKQQAPGKCAEHGLQLLARSEIEMVRRLVEREEVRLARGQPRE